jgi:hypothetical protein
MLWNRFSLGLWILLGRRNVYLVDLLVDLLVATQPWKQLRQDRQTHIHRVIKNKKNKHWILASIVGWRQGLVKICCALRCLFCRVPLPFYVFSLWLICVFIFSIGDWMDDGWKGIFVPGLQSLGVGCNFILIISNWICFHMVGPISGYEIYLKLASFCFYVLDTMI